MVFVRSGVIGTRPCQFIGLRGFVFSIPPSIPLACHNDREIGKNDQQEYASFAGPAFERSVVNVCLSSNDKK